MTAVDCDVAVVGAGPAGLTAALEAADAGCEVAVVDRYPAVGGQFHRRTAVAGSPAPPEPPLLSRVTASPRVRVLAATTVWAAEGDAAGGFTLHLSTTTGARGAVARVRSRVVIVASGALDRALPFPGWDLPGVVTVGAAQALLKGQGVRVGERVVVAGSGPFLLPVAAALAAAGTRVVGVAEATAARHLVRHSGLLWRHRRTVAEGVGYLRTLRRARVPLWTRRAVVRAHGDDRVESVTLARLRADWSVIPGSERTVAVDAVCVSFGFVPQVDVALALGCGVAPDPVWGDPAVIVDPAQATDRRGVLAAGEVTGVAGAVASAAEGGIAGVAAARALGRLDAAAGARRAAPHLRVRAAQRRFTAMLGARFGVRPGWTGWLDDTTVVCRCEEVDAGTVRRALDADGITDLRSLKLTTRVGMGRCQARVCGPAVAALVSAATGAPPADPAGLSGRPLLGPVALGHLAELGDR